jgi:hypothetical protein
VPRQLFTDVQTFLEQPEAQRELDRIERLARRNGTSPSEVKARMGRLAGIARSVVPPWDSAGGGA